MTADMQRRTYLYIQRRIYIYGQIRILVSNSSSLFPDNLGHINDLLFEDAS